MQSILELPSVPAEKRRAWLEFWVASQPAQLAVSAFVHEFAPLLSEAEIASFLDAERLWVPLSGLARSATGRSASLLWSWAATCALICGEVADLAPDLACAAVSADSDFELAWEAFEQSADQGLQPVMCEWIERWAATSSPLAHRAISRLERLAPHWQGASVRSLERLKSK